MNMSDTTRKAIRGLFPLFVIVAVGIPAIICYKVWFDNYYVDAITAMVFVAMAVFVLSVICRIIKSPEYPTNHEKKRVLWPILFNFVVDVMIAVMFLLRYV